MPTIFFLHLGQFQPAKVGKFQSAETGEYSTGVDKKRFNEISVPYYRRPIPGIPKEASGTRLTITGLREPWSHRALESLRTVLAELLNPFEMPSDFAITLDVVGSSKLSGPIQSIPPENPDFDLRFSIDAKGTLLRKMRTLGRKARS